MSRSATKSSERVGLSVYANVSRDQDDGFPVSFVLKNADRTATKTLAPESSTARRELERVRTAFYDGFVLTLDDDKYVCRGKADLNGAVCFAEYHYPLQDYARDKDLDEGLKKCFDQILRWNTG